MQERFGKYFKGDRIIWTTILFLCFFSILAVYSSTGTLAYREREGRVIYFLIRHSSFLFFGLLIVYVTHLIPYRFFSRLSQFLLFAAIPLLLITLVYGDAINEARRWVRIPGTSLTFQTSDFAKLALITYLARQLSLKQETIDSFKKAFLPLIVPVIVICGLIIPADVSTAMMLFLVSVTLLFIGRVPMKYLGTMVVGMLLLVGTLTVVGNSLGWEGRWKTAYARAETFLSGSGGADSDYQLEQSKIAIATSGIIGKGPGNSVQRNFLPHPYSDFIFAIIVEEWGFIGGLAVIFLYLYLLFRAIIIVRGSTRTFQAFVVFGLTFMLVVQALLNMSVAVGLVPVTGQPLPLISMGGTSIAFTALAFGIILSVSNNIQNAKNLQTSES